MPTRNNAAMPRTGSMPRRGPWFSGSSFRRSEIFGDFPEVSNTQTKAPLEELADVACALCTGFHRTSVARLAFELHHHIFGPCTGWSPTSLSAVNVVAAEATQADGSMAIMSAENGGAQVLARRRCNSSACWTVARAGFRSAGDSTLAHDRWWPNCDFQMDIADRPVAVGYGLELRVRQRALTACWCRHPDTAGAPRARSSGQ